MFFESSYYLFFEGELSELSEFIEFGSDIVIEMGDVEIVSYFVEGDIIIIFILEMVDLFLLENENELIRICLVMFF